MRNVLLCALAGVLIGGCAPSPRCADGAVCACNATEPCPDGLVCVGGSCVDDGLDSGSGSPDAGRDGATSDAACGDTTTDPLNCGRCGHRCASGVCTAGTCNAALSQCATIAVDSGITCNDVCSSAGAECAPRACGRSTYVTFGNADTCEEGGTVDVSSMADCDDAIVPGADATIWAKCCCR